MPAIPSLTYYALRRIKVGSSYRNPGDAVPEANGWRHASSWVGQGILAIVPASSETPHQRIGRPAGGKNHSQPTSSRGVLSVTPTDYTGGSPSVPHA